MINDESEKRESYPLTMDEIHELLRHQAVLTMTHMAECPDVCGVNRDVFLQSILCSAIAVSLFYRKSITQSEKDELIDFDYVFRISSRALIKLDACINQEVIQLRSERN